MKSQKNPQSKITSPAYFSIIAFLYFGIASVNAKSINNNIKTEKIELTAKPNEKEIEQDRITQAKLIYLTFQVKLSSLRTMRVNCSVAGAMENGSVGECVNKAKIEAEKTIQELIKGCNKANNPAGVDALIDYYAAWSNTMDFLTSQGYGRRGSAGFERRISELESEENSKEIKVKLKIPNPY